MLPDGAETLRLLMVRVLVKLFAVMLSIVTVSDAALVMRIADCAMDGGSASDQKRASSQKPSVEMIQLLVCPCETAEKASSVRTKSGSGNNLGFTTSSLSVPQRTSDPGPFTKQRGDHSRSRARAQLDSEKHHKVFISMTDRKAFLRASSHPVHDLFSV